MTASSSPELPQSPAPAAPADTDYSVLTPERVSLQLDVAGIGSRAAAALVDTAVQMVIEIALVIVVFTLLSPLGLASRIEGSLGEDAARWLGVAALILMLLGQFFVFWGYYAVFEIVWNGQTPGKRLVGIRVIRENGYPIRASDAVVRNLVRIFDGPPFGFVIGAVVMLANERARRPGDFAAGTLVVREARRVRLDQLPELRAVPVAVPAAATNGAAPAPAGAGVLAPAAGLSLAADDASLLRDYLVRRGELFEKARRDLSQRLALYLCRRYGLPEGQLTGPAEADAFLESLAA